MGKDVFVFCDPLSDIPSTHFLCLPVSRPSYEQCLDGDDRDILAVKGVWR